MYNSIPAGTPPQGRKVPNHPSMCDIHKFIFKCHAVQNEENFPVWKSKRKREEEKGELW